MVELIEFRKPRVPTALVYIFVFQNILNPVSPYLTLAINCTLAILVMSFNGMRFRMTDPMTLMIALAIFVWLIMVIVYRGDFEGQTLLKYIRTTLTIGVVTIFMGTSRIDPRRFLDAVSFTFGFHVVLVLLQIPFAGIVDVSAPIFGFNRELSILDQYALRKLGASSGYDTAAFFSVSSAVLFYLRNQAEKRPVFLLLLCLSLGAGMMSSRVGIVMTTGLLIFIGAKGIQTARLAVKLILAIGLIGFLAFCYISIYPLIQQTLGLRDLGVDDATLFFAATDYGSTGTLEALTGEHIAPLKVAPLDLMVGFAVDPNTAGKPSDIGYVKFIYHVGIIGTLLIILLHLRMVRLTALRVERIRSDIQLRSLSYFLIWLIGSGLLFNYKSLELYSRGIGDFIIILFLFLATRWDQRFHENA